MGVPVSGKGVRVGITATFVTDGKTPTGTDNKFRTQVRRSVCAIAQTIPSWYCGDRAGELNDHSARETTHQRNRRPERVRKVARLLCLFVRMTILVAAQRLRILHPMVEPTIRLRSMLDLM